MGVHGLRKHEGGADPVVGVVPGGGGDGRVRFGRMVGVGRLGGVGGVEVGVEGDGVVGVALQRAQAVVMDARRGFRDGLGEHRVRADLDEGGWSAPAVAMAWRNRTGLRRLVTQWSASNSVVALGVFEAVVRPECAQPRRQSASAARSSGRIGSIIGWWDATSMFTLRAKVFCWRAVAIRSSIASVGPAITVWRGEAYTVTDNLRVVGDQRLGRLGVESTSATAPWPASCAISRDRVAITRNPSATVSAPATTAAVISPIECPMTASGSTP